VNDQRIDRIRFVTRHFNELQGLRAMVPCGLILMGLGSSEFHYLPLTILDLLITLGVTVVILRARPYYRRTFGEVEQQPVLVDAGLPSIYSPAGPAPLVIGRWRATRTVLIPIFLGCALFLVLRAFLPTATLTIDRYGGYLVDLSNKPILPHSWPELKSVFGQGMCALYGSCFLGIWLRRERRLSQGYCLVFGALLLGLAVLGASLALVMPALSHIPHILYFCLVALTRPEVALMLCGGTFFICGLLDHLQIARVLRPALEEPA
jgi:hypothetical protein